MRHMLLGAAALALAPAALRAQGLGPFRQFLSVEPYYVNVQADDGGSAAGRTSLNGFGARLWINYAPFVRSRTLAKGGIALFAHGTPEKDGIATLHYGVQQDAFLFHRPLGGVIDPVLSVGAGAYRTRVRVVSPAGGTFDQAETKFALTPGVGVRIPMPNRLQLRVDARDALVFGARGADGRTRTSGNLEFTGAIGLTL